MSDQRQAEVSTSTPTVVETPVSTDPAPEGTQPLSKKAQKRAAKQEQWEAKKLERRAREREVKKEKKRILAEKRAAGELEDDVSLNKKAKKRKIDFGGRVVVDLGFDELMNDKVRPFTASYSLLSCTPMPFFLSCWFYIEFNSRLVPAASPDSSPPTPAWVQTLGSQVIMLAIGIYLQCQQTSLVSVRSHFFLPQWPNPRSPGKHGGPIIQTLDEHTVVERRLRETMGRKISTSYFCRAIRTRFFTLEVG